MPVKNRIVPGDGDSRHGTLNGYTNHACRCDLCTEAHRVAHLAYMHGSEEQRARHAERENARYHGRT